ncbi:MAG: hypothetical protein Q7T82_02345 [Armatimonadota bacterium]|nr:hypothetical protein [Armatimonadota bacterium]
MPDWYGEFDLQAEIERKEEERLERERSANAATPLPWWMDIIGLFGLLAFIVFFIWPINIPLILCGFVMKPEQMGGWLGRLFLWACVTLLLMWPIGLVAILIGSLVSLCNKVTASYRRCKS